jgi:hypothetical protein
VLVVFVAVRVSVLEFAFFLAFFVFFFWYCVMCVHVQKYSVVFLVWIGQRIRHEIVIVISGDPDRLHALEIEPCNCQGMSQS